jgi:hypothetical protein
LGGGAQSGSAGAVHATDTVLAALSIVAADPEGCSVASYSGGNRSGGGNSISNTASSAALPPQASGSGVAAFLWSGGLDDCPCLVRSVSAQDRPAAASRLQLEVAAGDCEKMPHWAWLGTPAAPLQGGVETGSCAEDHDVEADEFLARAKIGVAEGTAAVVAAALAAAETCGAWSAGPWAVKPCLLLPPTPSPHSSPGVGAAVEDGAGAREWAGGGEAAAGGSAAQVVQSYLLVPAVGHLPAPPVFASPNLKLCYLDCEGSAPLAQEPFQVTSDLVIHQPSNEFWAA